MEVCGTHTVAIFRYGIRQMLPSNIQLLSGPGCPVCVTAISDIDKAIELSQQKDVILVTFGDMMRVPGSKGSLQSARSEGADIRVVYSPMDGFGIARHNPDKAIVFLAAGFETTSPTIAATIRKAEQEGIDNFLFFSVLKLVPPALKALLETPELRVSGFLSPGHVSVIIGGKPYDFIARDYQKAVVISGFEAVDILQSVLMLIKQIEAGSAKVEIEYTRAVSYEGNKKALELLREVFEPVDAH